MTSFTTKPIGAALFTVTLAPSDADAALVIAVSFAFVKVYPSARM